MAFPILPAIGAIGGLLGGIAGIKSSKNQKKATDAQASIAKDQQGLFQQASPQYLQLLQQLQRHAGMGQPGQNPYQFPQDKLRLLQANEQIGRNYGRAADQFSFGLGRRGLQGSSMDVAGRAALLQDAERQRAGFQRQLAINAPLEYERRLGLLANALNPGLGAGAAAGATFGQQAGMFGNQAAQAFGGLGSAVQNLIYNQQLQQLLRQQQQGSLGYTGGFGGVPGGVNANDFLV